MITINASWREESLVTKLATCLCPKWSVPTGRCCRATSRAHKLWVNRGNQVYELNDRIQQSSCKVY